jgi:hypothetical protein
MRILRRTRLLGLFLSLPLLSAADVVYAVAVDTHTISGTAGSIDFNLNPGPLVTQAASLDILTFGGNGTLVTGSCASGGPCLTGDVSGTLPSTVTFDNGTGFNDYFQGFTFGSSLVFDLRLYGPAVNAPDGTPTSGSTFAFSLFSDSAGTIPTLTTDLINGFAATIDLNLDGSTTVNDLSAQTSINQVSAVPEPSDLLPLGIVIILLGVKRSREPRRLAGGQ